MFVRSHDVGGRGAQPHRHERQLHQRREPHVHEEHHIPVKTKNINTFMTSYENGEKMRIFREIIINIYNELRKWRKNAIIARHYKMEKKYICETLRKKTVSTLFWQNGDVILKNIFIRSRCQTRDTTLHF